MPVDLLFLLSVFVAVILLSQALMLPIYRPQRGNTRYIKERLQSMQQQQDAGKEQVSLLRSQKLKHAGDFGRWLEQFEFVHQTSMRLEQSGSGLLGYEYLARAIVATLVAAVAIIYWSNSWLYGLIVAVAVLLAANFHLNRRFYKRIDTIEEQFPEALDIIGRGLQAGYAFSDAIKLAYEEMDGPMAAELRLVFADINYRKNVKLALLFFIERVPTVSAMAFSSSVMVQKETGGNLAENVKKLANIIRQRFAFKRKVKTLSAEGRMSAWVLVLMPMGLFAFLYINSPDYAKELTETESGNELLLYGAIAMAIGIYWLSRLIKLDV